MALEPTTTGAATAAQKPKPPKPVYSTAQERLPYLDVEWKDRFLQIQYTAVIDITYNDYVFTITTTRYVITLRISPAEKTFDVAKFRTDFQSGRVTHIRPNESFGATVTVKEITKNGLREL